jgi:dTDP-4-dehydrorhamnose 3,5-epimerase
MDGRPFLHAPRNAPWHDLAEETSGLKTTPTDLPDVLLIHPAVHRDDRGFFLETYHAERYEKAGLSKPFVQDNHSRSARGTLRGLHAQIERPQGKLVRVTQGEVLDVAVDIRHGSPTFGQHVGVVLTAEGFEQLWIPEGFAHGFCVLSETAELQYKCTDFYDPTSELTIAWDDPDIGIRWPAEEPPLLSEKDRLGIRLADCATDLLPHYSV